MLLSLPNFLKAQTIIKVTGKIYELNGVSDVPAGIFGVHAGNFQGLDSAKIKDWGIGSVRAIEVIPSGNPYSAGSGPIPAGTPEIVHCWFDRFVPARQVINPNGWSRDLKTRAANYAQATIGLNNPPILEFWNEPYLNWAYKPGVNTDPQYFDSTGVQVGDSVRLRGTNYFQKSLLWRRAQWYRGNWAANTSGLYVAISQAWNAQLTARNIPYPGLTGALLPGEVYFPNTNRQFVVTEQLRPIDPTQQSFYSARQGSIYYNEMLSAVLDTALLVNPGLKVLGGWGFEVHKDRYQPFKDLFKPMLDAFGDRLYGVHEHHYGMDTRIIANDYQTLYAYNKLKHGKPLKFYNTETGGFNDPQRPNQSVGGTGNLSANQRSYLSYQYHGKDIIYLLSQCHDKVGARAIHEPQLTNGGVESLLKQMKSFRGKMLMSGSNDPNVLVAACLTDTTMEVAYFVNGPTLGPFMEHIFIAPQGRTITSVTAYAADTAAGLGTGVTNQVASGDTVKINTLTSNSPLRAFFFRVRLSPSGQPAQIAQTIELIGDKVLAKLNPNEVTTVSFEATPPNFNAQDLELKLGLFDYGTNPDIRLTFNGYNIPVNPQGGNTFDNTGGITSVRIPISYLQANNSLTITNVTDSLLVTFATLRLNNDTLFHSPTGLSWATSRPNFALYPNPGKDQVSLTIQEKGIITFSDNTGRVVHQDEYIPGNAIKVKNFKPGAYLVTLLTGSGKSFSAKWIKMD